MLKIITVDSLSQRRLVVRGKLVEPWVGQFQRLWEEGLESHDGRDFVVDLRDVTAINQHAENILTDMIARGVQLISGAITKQLIEQLENRLNRWSASEVAAPPFPPAPVRLPVALHKALQ